MGYWVWLLTASFAVSTAAFTHAQDESPSQSATYPYTGTLKREEVNVRAGPGTRYPILWVFQRRGWPVQVLTKYDNWLKIRDVEGEEGWVYVGMVNNDESAIVAPGEPVTLYKRANATKPVYRLAPGVAVKIDSCRETQCEIEVKGTSGYVAAERLIRL